LPPCDPIEVIVPEWCGVSARSGAAVRRTALDPDEIVEVEGLPTTSPLRTSADLGRYLPVVDAVVAIDMALHQGLASLAELWAYTDAIAGSKGVTRLRRALDLAECATESPMETRLRLLLVQSGLPRPEVQVTLHDRLGRFLARPDLLYRAHGLAIEYDGGTHRDSIAEDNRRQNRLTAAGFKLLRFVAGDLQRTPDTVVALVRNELARANQNVHLPADARYEARNSVHFPANAPNWGVRPTTRKPTGRDARPPTSRRTAG
jgi:very-short-patch-repair endonuclease